MTASYSHPASSFSYSVPVSLGPSLTLVSLPPSQLAPSPDSKLSLLTPVPRKDLKELVVTDPGLGHIVLLQGSLNHTGGLVLTSELGREGVK